MPITCPKKGIVGCTTGGSRGSIFARRRLARKTAVAIASPSAPKVMVEIAILTNLLRGAAKEVDFENGDTCSGAPMGCLIA